MPTTTVKVFLWGEEIGQLNWHKQRDAAYFNFNPAFLEHQVDIAPLAAPVGARRNILPFYGEQGKIYQNLPSFIADSLPDSWGNELFEQWCRTQRLTKKDVTPLEKPAFIGSRGMGALEYVPDLLPRNYKETIDIKSLAALAQKIVEQRESAKILPDEQLSLKTLIMVGTSVGGRQPKALIAVNDATGEIHSGQLLYSTPHTYHIIKFGDVQRSTAEIEMAYYQMAVDAGIDMMPSGLLCVDGIQHFTTQRFDRQGGSKWHAQTLAAIEPEADSYERLIEVCRKLHLPEPAVEEVYRRMIFNILANNTDDHNKNFSFILPQNGAWRLAPAYDMTFIFNSGGYQPYQTHCLMMRGKRENITLRDALDFARDNSVRRPAAIIRRVANSLSSWRKTAQSCGVGAQWIGRIETCINEHLSAWNLSDVPIPTHNTTMRLEQAYKGNFHLIWEENGQTRKYVIRKGTKMHDIISEQGADNISPELLQALLSSNGQ